MDTRRLAYNYIPLWAFIAFITFLSYMFFLRPPVILVSDIYAHALYGEQWEQTRVLEASFRILRPVRVFRIMTETDSQTIADTIMNARSTPHSVFFPFRYEEAARFYGKELERSKNTTTKIFLFLNRQPHADNTESLIRIQTNTGIDYYRAGYAAAILSREAGAALPGNSGGGREIVFINNIQISDSEKSAFERGLHTGSYYGGVRFVLNTDSGGNQDVIDCIVIAGPAAAFLQSARTTPVILLSWFFNENYLPPNVKIQIDDSSFALIPKAVKTRMNQLRAGNTLTLPNDFNILKDNIVNKKLIPELQKAVNARLPSEITP
jgi:hypothetical protein